jgi:hypothetical protein
LFNEVNTAAAKVNFTDNGEVACSTMELTASGRSKVWDINGSCYTGGVDGHQSRGWVIRDNTIEGFWCENGLSEHGVHFWTGSRDTLVERNTFRAIGFGLRETGSGRTYSDDPCPAAVGLVGHYDGIIRNNFIFADDGDLFDSSSGVDGGIAFAQSCGAQAVHNTIGLSWSDPNQHETRIKPAGIVQNMQIDCWIASRHEAIFYHQTLARQSCPSSSPGFFHSPITPDFDSFTKRLNGCILMVCAHWGNFL